MVGALAISISKVAIRYISKSLRHRPTHQTEQGERHLEQSIRDVLPTEMPNQLL